MNLDILDNDSISNIISKYSTYEDFTHNEKSLYNKLIKLGAIEKFTSHLPRNIHNWNVDSIKNEVSKYTRYSDFLNNSSKCYQSIKRNKLEYLLDGLTRTNNLWNFDKICQLISENNFTTSYQLKKHYNGAYSYLLKHKLLNEAKLFMQDRLAA